MIHKIISVILSANLELFGEAVLFKEARPHLKMDRDCIWRFSF